MNPRRQSFVRKIIYLVAIAILLTAISFLGRPSTIGKKRVQGSPGGILAQRRVKEGLNQADLGQIDPTSETIKYATLGMRGIAANVLWHKATEYQKKKDWTNLKAAVNQIIRVQPNFVAVWRFYGWNLAFNVSVEFDNFRDRYYWVIQGIEFYEEGTKYNEHSPRLAWETGWAVQQKIGRSDEKKQFRRLFARDDDFHGNRVGPERDCWLVAREWYLLAEEKVDLQGDKMSGTSPVVFRSSAPMCLIKYAGAKEDEGTFGDVACGSWRKAYDYWVGNEERDIIGYGQKDIPTSFDFHIRLNDQERLEKKAEKEAEKLDAIQPGLREKIRQERYEGLTEEMREAFDTPAAERTGKQHGLASKAKAAMKVTHKDVAKRIKGSMRDKAVELADKATDLEWQATITRRYRDIVNFVYWRDRAKIEQEPDTLLARESIYDGDLAFADGRPNDALECYDRGFEAWSRVLKKHEIMLQERKTSDTPAGIEVDVPTFRDDLVDVIERYRKILDQLDMEFPKDFILQKFLDKYADKQ